MGDPSAPKFGLPRCLWVPIAACDAVAIETFVGRLLAQRVRKDGRIDALLIETHAEEVPEQASARVPLWQETKAPIYRNILFPPRQVWVHVDYAGYRKAYRDFGMPPIPAGAFLDHIQNREAIRLRDYSHPYIRLCPVSHRTNTSGGHSAGGEGMEKEYLRSRKSKSKKVQQQFRAELAFKVQYADPMDLTKMLDVAPGTETLPGVRDLQHLFYPQ
jgi:hypothetical protein